jgi:hypothetical protein
MGQPSGKDFHSLMAFHSVLPENEQMAFQAALKWLQLGMKSVFLQDVRRQLSGRRHLDPQA